MLIEQLNELIDLRKVRTENLLIFEIELAGQ